MRQRVASALLVTLVAATAAARAEDSAVKAEVQSIYDRIGKAIEKKDIDAVTKFSLSDAAIKYADGAELTLAQWKERSQKGWANLKQTKSRFLVEAAKSAGDVATATYSETHDMLAVDPKDNAEHKFRYDGKWRVTLQRTAAGWRINKSIELERKMTRDGELIDQWPKEKAKP